MKRRSLKPPVLFAIAATRALLGAGVGLLVAPRLADKRRRAVGLTLVGIGVASTIPLASFVLGRSR